MAAPFLSAEDLRERWPGCPPEVEAVTAAVNYASSLLRSEIPSIDDRMEDGSLDSVIVQGVVASMVRRHLSDPIISEQLGVFSTRFDTSWMEGGIYPTDAELATLRPRPARATSRYGTARPRIGLAPR